MSFPNKLAVLKGSQQADLQTQTRLLELEGESEAEYHSLY
jgi:hypothetical protein